MEGGLSSVRVCVRCGTEHGGAWCPRCGLEGVGPAVLLGLVPHAVAGVVVAWIGVPVEFVVRGLLSAQERPHNPVTELALLVAGAIAKVAPVLYAALGGALAARVPKGLRWPGRAALGVVIGAGALAFIMSWQDPRMQQIWDRDTRVWIGPASALAAVIGAVWGASLFDDAARAAPFRWFVPVMGRVPWPLRMAVLVPVATAVFALGVSAALALVLALCALLVVATVLGALFGSRSSSSEPSYVRRRPSREEEPEPEAKPVISLPRGARVDADGRIMQRDGWFTERPTGMRIGADGRVVNEGLFIDTPTGVKIDADGRIVQEGVLFDSPTGARLRDGELVREGVLFDQASGVGFDASGRVVSKGVLNDEETGVEVLSDGTIRRRGGDRS